MIADGMRRWASRVTLGLLSITAPIALATELEVRLVINSHRFMPAELRVPAGQKIRLLVENQDTTPEEFESYALNREKVVAGGGRIVIFIGPLKPGRYEFFGDFNAKTARGALVAQ